MVTLLILTMLAILFLLVVIPWPFSLPFRLLLGLIMTWPVMTLYARIDLPAGIPDLHYHRGYVGLLVLMTFLSLLLTPQNVQSRLNAGRARRARVLGRKKQSFASAIAPLRLGVTGSVATVPGQFAPTALAGTTATSTVNRDATGTRSMPADNNPPSIAAAYQQPLPALPLAVQGYIVLTVLSIFIGMMSGNSSAAVVASYVDTTLVPIALYFFTKSLIASRRHLVWFLIAVVVMSIVVCFTGLYEVFLDLTDSAFPISPHNDVGDTRYLDVPGGRAAGVFGSPAVFGGVVGMGLLASVCLLAHAPTKRVKFLLGGIAVVLAYGVFATFTRSVWISVSFALLITPFYFNGLWKLTLPLALASCLVGAFLWSGLQNSDVMTDRVLNEDTATGRVERFLWSGEQFIEQPWGRGPGALDRIMNKAFPEDGFSTSHNTYMSMLVDNGIFAFMCLAYVVGGWFLKTSAVLRSPKQVRFERSAAVAMAGFLIVVILCGMSLELRYFAFYLSMFWVAGGVIERACFVCQQAQPEGRRLTS